MGRDIGRSRETYLERTRLLQLLARGVDDGGGHGRRLVRVKVRVRFRVRFRVRARAGVRVGVRMRVRAGVRVRVGVRVSSVREDAGRGKGARAAEGRRAYRAEAP